VRLDKSVLQKYNGNITQGGQMGLWKKKSAEMCPNPFFVNINA
jgi:hypothetical protein